METGSSAAPQDVLVLGGGLIGLCSAYALLRDGHRVTLVDRDRPGSGAARGNAGEITPLTALPLAGPGMMRETVRGVLTRSHFLSIAPLALPALTAFGVSFLAHCSPGRLAAGTRALDQLVRGAFAAFDAYRADGISLAGGGSGYLYTHRDAEALAAYRDGMVARADHLGLAAPEPILRGGAVQEAEPALAASVGASFVAPSERFIDPGILVDELEGRVRAAGARVISGAEAVRVEGAGSRRARGARPAAVVRTAAGAERIEASRIVVACGSRTGAVLRASGARVPARLSVRPGRGYSCTVGAETLPRALLGSLDRRTVAIPLSGRLRIVGLMDFDGSHERFDPRRMRQLAARASGFVRGLDWGDVTEEWVGARPMTPSGLPIVSPLPGDPRIVVATGHNMHGVSLGPVTGELVAALVEGRPGRIAGADVDMRPFALRAHTRGASRRSKGQTR